LSFRAVLQAKNQSIEMNWAERFGVVIFYFFMPVMFILIMLSIVLAILVDNWTGPSLRPSTSFSPPHPSLCH
jgi:hypothetical protein